MGFFLETVNKTYLKLKFIHKIEIVALIPSML